MPSSNQPVGKDLFHQDLSTIQASAVHLGDAIQLVLGQEYWEGRSLFVAELDGTGVSIRLPIALAEQLRDALVLLTEPNDG